jgi:hypothetical protein
MSIRTKLYFILKLIIVASFFLPMISTKAAGSLKLVNQNEYSNGGLISFYSDKVNESGYTSMLDKICINGILINLKDYNYVQNPKLPQIENIYKGSLIKPKSGKYTFVYPENENCNISKSSEFVLTVKPFHIYELNLVANSIGGFDLSLKQDRYDGDVAFTTIDNNIVYDGSTRREVGNCLDNVLVSTLSNSSKMAFLTTSDDEPDLPKVTVGEHIVSSFDGENCADNGIKVDIKPITWYVFEVPLDGSQQSVAQSSTAIKQEYIVESPDVGRGASTVRTGGYSLHSYNFLILLLKFLLQLIIPNQLKG